MKAIIVDDEPKSHTALKSLIAEYHEDIELVAFGYNVAEGCELIEKHQPDLVFLDVEMPDGLGFDIFNKYPEPEFQVIFITGHQHYAQTAIKFGALDYLLKPINKDELADAIEKAKKNREDKISREQLEILWETLQNLNQQKLPSRIVISTQDGVFFRQVKDIIRLDASESYTDFILQSAPPKIIASQNIKKFEEQFEPYFEFMRVHRSHIVNLNFIDRYVKNEGGYLILQDGSKISVSKRYKDDLLDRLGRL